MIEAARGEAAPSGVTASTAWTLRDPSRVSGPERPAARDAGGNSTGPAAGTGGWPSGRRGVPVTGPAASPVAAFAACTGARSAIGAGIGGRPRTRACRTSSVFQRWYPPAAPAPTAASNDNATPVARPAPWRRGRPRGSKTRCVIERDSRTSTRSGEGREERRSRGSAPATAVRTGSGGAGRYASRPGSSPADSGAGSIDVRVAGARSPSPPASIRRGPPMATVASSSMRWSPSPPASTRRGRGQAVPPGTIDVRVAGARSPSPPVSARKGCGQSIPPRTVVPAPAPRTPGCRSCAETWAFPADGQCRYPVDPGRSCAETPAFPAVSPESVVCAGKERSERAGPKPGAPGSSSSFVTWTGASRHSPGAAGTDGSSSSYATGDRAPGSAPSRFARTGPRSDHPGPSEPNGWSTPSAAGSARASPVILNASIGGVMAVPGPVPSRFAWTGPRSDHPSPSESNGWSIPSAAGSTRTSPVILNASIGGFMAMPGSVSSRFAWTGPRPAHSGPSEPDGWSTPSAAGSARASPVILDASIGGVMAAPRTKAARRRAAPGAASRCSRGGRAGTPGNPPPRSGSG